MPADFDSANQSASAQDDDQENQLSPLTAQAMERLDQVLAEIVSQRADIERLQLPARESEGLSAVLFIARLDKIRISMFQNTLRLAEDLAYQDEVVCSLAELLQGQKLSKAIAAFLGQWVAQIVTIFGCCAKHQRLHPIATVELVILLKRLHRQQVIPSTIII